MAAHYYGEKDDCPRYLGLHHRPLNKLLPSSNPLLQSPLYFRSDQGPPATKPARKSPISLNRPSLNHSHWVQDTDKSHRRSLPPPDICQYRSSHSPFDDDRSLCSTVVSPRRRSLPPNIGSPQHRQEDIYSKLTAFGNLWSVQENDRDEQEPMDISPVKPYPSPTHDRRERGAITNNKRNLFPGLTPTKSTFRTPSKHKLKSTGLQHANGFDSPGIRKLSKKVDKVTPSHVPNFFLCRFILATMFVQIAAGAFALVSFLLGSDIANYWCQHHQDLNTTLLSQSLKQQVFGQHIAIDVIPKVLEMYLENNDTYNKKPHVLSFHGWTGVGKNHVSSIIGDHLRRGIAKKVICPHHFPHRDEDYSAQFREMTIPKLSTCSLNLFVVDEIDKAPPNVAKALYETLTELRSPKYEAYLDHVKVVFLLLSNTGASQINAKVFEALYHDKRKRESLTLAEVNAVLLDDGDATTTRDPVPWFSRLHKAGLIDTVVPFLPLEKEHVQSCIEQDMKEKGIEANERTVNAVLEQMSFSPFSKWGCRKVTTKVDIIQN